MVFLMTRALKSEFENWEILKRKFRFVHCNFKLKMCFGVMSLDKIFIWVDASCAVHHDMMSQTGGVMSMGLGVTRFGLS